MNRPLLLVICDFLLLSLLALAQFDVPEPIVAEPVPGRQLEEEVGFDLMLLLEQSLEEEADARARLESALTETRGDLDLTREQLDAKELALREREEAMRRREEELARQGETLQERERELGETRQDLEAWRQRSAQLDQERERAEMERRQLEEERGTLVRELATTRTGESVSRERIRQLEERVAEREAEITRREQALLEAREREELLARRSRELETTVEVARVERSSLEERLATVQTDVEREREGRRQALATTERLTEGVTRLADTSDAISDEVRRLRPITANEIFERYDARKVEITFDATEQLLLGQRERRISTPTLVVEDDDQLFALLHIDDSPFAHRWSDGTVARVDGYITIGSRTFRLNEIRFLTADPRILAIPLPRRLLEENEWEAARLATDPFHFERTVVINNRDHQFGESGFRLRTDGLDYVELDRRILSRIFGDFGPKTGNLVMTRSGNLLGVVVDSRHAPVLRSLKTDARIRLGDAFSSAESRETLERQRAAVPRL